MNTNKPVEFLKFRSLELWDKMIKLVMENRILSEWDLASYIYIYICMYVWVKARTRGSIHRHNLYSREGK